MAELTIQDNPTISDTIVFTLNTPGVDGCLTANPYKVDKLVIYYVERNFTSGKLSTYENKTYDLNKLRAAEEAEATACVTPTETNINTAKALRMEAESSVSLNPFYFNEAKPVHIIGNDDYPAWLSTDLDNAFLENTDTGVFTYTWQPEGMREGDYFICWTWTPLIAGDSLSDNQKFWLVGDTQVTTSIPTHFTDPEKYPTLLERYLPEMFKMSIANLDRTPDVLETFNEALALGFNTLEDLANQLPDLQDANSVHESFIPYLSNLFGLKLKTGDPTRWRGQIKRAIPLYKMKGTKKGLGEALEHAGITLLKLDQLWQIISSYTWQEVFTYSDSYEFALERVAETLDEDNFELWIRPSESDDWIQLTSDYVDFDTVDGVTTMTWIGNTLSVDAIDLIEGDEIKVLYLYEAVPGIPEQTIEDYIRTLPLMDQRDERDQDYPPKNWNVRVIAKDDPLFDVIIPQRNPFYDLLIYGKIRTEFPYSENIYNMEEYNGSIRNSKNPCDIDKSFVDPCSACIGSCYNISLEIEELSDDRIEEAREVLAEYTPFHAVLHTLNFVGGINEFVESPVEEVDALITITGGDFVVSGDAQMYFNRIMKLVSSGGGILRSELADSFVALPTTTGLAYNNIITMFCPTTQLDDLGIALDGSATMVVKAPSPLAGTYSVDDPNGNTITVTSGSLEPIDDCNTFFASDGTLNTCAFTFDINNPAPGIDGTLCDIAQDNLVKLGDSTQDFGELGVQSTVDVEDGNASYAWTVLITDYSPTAYVIHDILPSGELVLEDDGTLPSTSVSGVTYVIYNDLTPVATSTCDLTVVNRGRVTALNSGVIPVQDVMAVGINYYQEVGGTEYFVSGFVSGEDDQYYIDGYSDGDAAGVTIIMCQKIIKNLIGYLSHRGLMLQMDGNLEQDLGIQNGVNSYVVTDDGVENDGFKENFIVVIDGDEYWISEIDGTTPSGKTTITLSGLDHYWQTLSAGGTSVNVTIYQYLKLGATIMGQQFELPEHTFYTLDRSGRPVITGELADETILVSLNDPENMPEGSGISESIYQGEGISFQIQYDDGTSEEGQI